MGAGIVCGDRQLSVLSGQDTIDGEVLQGSATDIKILPDSSSFVPSIGTSFGVVLYSKSAAHSKNYRAVVAHPPMGPEARTDQSWAVTAPAGTHAFFVGYTLEDEIELVPGQWMFFLLEEDKTMVMTHRFDLLPSHKGEAAVLSCP
ncbi:DUF3859 domain-containing protein [Shimia sp. MIT1388]|uniref:DUF3859 domain-containing protein n=1 Tax=Shimia sp. MIT1388 TaxID=3096992 RepID=UPI00399ABAFD